MSKKKFKKFKSQAKPAEKIIRTEINQAGETVSVVEPKVSPVETKKLDHIEELNQKYAFVRKDVGKLLIVLGSLALLFVGFYFLGTETKILANVGDWIYKISNFQLD
jgi:hypothetical protein